MVLHMSLLHQCIPLSHPSLSFHATWLYAVEDQQLRHSQSHSQSQSQLCPALLHHIVLDHVIHTTFVFTFNDVLVSSQMQYSSTVAYTNAKRAGIDRRDRWVIRQSLPVKLSSDKLGSNPTRSHVSHFESMHGRIAISILESIDDNHTQETRLDLNLSSILHLHS